MREMQWEPRYARLTALCTAKQAGMPPGRLEHSTAFARRLFPDLMDQSATEIYAFHHWLRMVAQHNGAAAGHEFVTPTRGFGKGKRVKKWLWGNTTPSVEEFL